MANSTNSLSSNFATKLAKGFLQEFEASRVLTKTVDTQRLSGKFNPASGTTVDFKRPHDFKTDRTSDGDISSTDKSDIISGKATGTVQDYFTVHVDWDSIDESLKLDELQAILKPAATRMVTDLEIDLAKFMYKNVNLHVGTPGTAIDAWADIATAGSLMDSIGVPPGERCYVANPYTIANLAGVQYGLNGTDSAISTAWQNAQTTNNVGDMRLMSSNALASLTSGTLSAGADRAGAIVGSPTVTYAGAKDTMTQSIAVDGFGAGSDTIKAGEIVQVTGRNRVSLSSREAFLDGSGAQVLWSGVVTADVTLSGGAGTLVVAGPASYEANGQYNTTSSALADNDVVTILNPAASTVYQPSLFYAKSAFGLGSVPQKKLYSTDCLATTEDGIQIRVSKFADGSANRNTVRFDLLPAYACFNPFHAGQGFGIA